MMISFTLEKNINTGDSIIKPCDLLWSYFPQVE